MPESYDDLLAALKAKSDDRPSNEAIATMRHKATYTLNKLKSDLENIVLDNSDTLSTLLRILFKEQGFEKFQIIYLSENDDVFHDDLAADNEISLGAAILGVQSKGAFNISVVYANKQTIVRFSKVPQNGNLRGGI